MMSAHTASFGLSVTTAWIMRTAVDVNTHCVRNCKYHNVNHLAIESISFLIIKV